VSEHQPRGIPSKKWRELIKKVWEVDPMICPDCQLYSFTQTPERLRLKGFVLIREKGFNSTP
jgi:hypothetical protein